MAVPPVSAPSSHRLLCSLKGHLSLHLRRLRETQHGLALRPAIQSPLQTFPKCVTFTGSGGSARLFSSPPSTCYSKRGPNSGHSLLTWAHGTTPPWRGSRCTEPALHSSGGRLSDLPPSPNSRIWMVGCGGSSGHVTPLSLFRVPPPRAGAGKEAFSHLLALQGRPFHEAFHFSSG